MRNVYLMMHQKREDIPIIAAQVSAALQSAGIDVGMEAWPQQGSGTAAASFAEANRAEAIIALGGDGTLLRATQTAIQWDVPVLGINIGRIGFLVEAELSQLTDTCRRLREDDFTIETRMMLDVMLPDGSTRSALNDVVLSRGGYARLIAVKASVKEEMIGRYIADGLIIATPTGSTGYSLSAGGPIVCPEVECILLSPICPHSLQHRPVIAAASETIVITLDCSPEQTAQLDVDGHKAITLTGSQQVTVCRSRTVARLIRFGAHSFFHRIRDKLTEWSC